MTQTANVLIPAPIVAASMAGLPVADTFLIGIDACPGQARLTSANSPRGWDERQSYGMGGATLVPTGDHLSTIVFHVILWCETDATGSPQGQQWTAWQTFFAKYLSKAVRFVPGSTKARALGIYHPALAAHLITEVVVEDVTVPVQPDGEDYFECEIHFREFRAPQLAPPSPEAAIPAAQQAQPGALDGWGKEAAGCLAAIDELGRQVFGP